MNLISFPHYTCGGLLCDILNQTFSNVNSNGGINSLEHSIGKIGDSVGVFDEFSAEEFYSRLLKMSTDKWIGTHCWLGNIPLLPIDRVINITTATFKSRLYRWVRAYYHYYLKSEPWQGLQGIEQIDKQRETAKNYVKPFLPISDTKVVNLEFSDVVETKPAFIKLVGNDYQNHISRWQQINHFLYNKDILFSTAAERFHEAEFELTVGMQYTYQ